MKPPRWLIMLMIASSVAIMVGAAAWWWAIWPESVAQQFARLLAARRIPEAGQMVRAVSGVDHVSLIDDAITDCTLMSLECGPRTILDILAGRRHFRVHGINTPAKVGFCGFARPTAEDWERLTKPRPTALSFTTERGYVIQPFCIISENFIIVLDAHPHLESLNPINTSSSW